MDCTSPEPPHDLEQPLISFFAFWSLAKHLLAGLEMHVCNAFTVYVISCLWKRDVILKHMSLQTIESGLDDLKNKYPN